MTADDVFLASSRRLFGIAYRMLGQVAEAEDAVQETYVRWARTQQSTVDNPAAWLTTVVTRICLDRLKSAQQQRETYVGTWLPEPLATDDIDPADVAGTSDSITLAFLVVLERLSPAERAVFLLHEVFGYQHTEIAAMLERSPAAVRQLGARARRHIAERRPRYEDDSERHRAVTQQFLSALDGGDLDDLMALLAPDVTFLSDGGGVVVAARRPLHGAQRVASLILRFAAMRTPEHGVDLRQVNGRPGLVISYRGTVEGVWSLDVVDGRIAAVHVVRNPDKLRYVI